jgi:hypothetical protein
MGQSQKPAEPCCPPFDPSVWDGREIVWRDKPFIKGSIPLLFHIPWPPMIGRLMTKLWNAAKAADAAPELSDFLCLVTDPSPWRGEYYITVTRPVPGMENVCLSGTFLTRVFDGPYSAVPKWIKAMEAHARAQGKQIKKHYFYYTTCPKCAKLRGKNYVVAFGQVE